MKTQSLTHAKIDNKLPTEINIDISSKLYADGSRREDGKVRINIAQKMDDRWKTMGKSVSIKNSHEHVFF